jgi:hypothetical protein
MITILFSCNECGIKKHKLQIPARESPEHNVCEYMKMVAAWVGDEHKKISPNCKATKISDLMIPMDGADFIGQQVE